MTGKTHSSGGSLAALVGVIILREQAVVIGGVGFFVQFLLIYPFAMYGGILPDIDHHLNASPLKDPVNVVLNKTLHIVNKPYNKYMELVDKPNKKSFKYKFLNSFRCVHRSWQTHSEIVLLGIILLIMFLLNNNFGTSGVILTIVLVGLGLGVVSHIVLDMMTTAGVPFLTGKVLNKAGLRVLPEKIRLVPNTSFFATGTKYEEVVRKIIRVVSFILIIYIIWQYVLVETLHIGVSPKYLYYVLKSYLF